MDPATLLLLAVVLIGVGEIAIKFLIVAGLAKTTVVENNRRVAVILAAANLLVGVGAGIFLLLLIFSGDFISTIASSIIK